MDVQQRGASWPVSFSTPHPPASIFGISIRSRQAPCSQHSQPGLEQHMKDKDGWKDRGLGMVCKPCRWPWFEKAPQIINLMSLCSGLDPRHLARRWQFHGGAAFTASFPLLPSCPPFAALVGAATPLQGRFSAEGWEKGWDGDTSATVAQLWWPQGQGQVLQRGCSGSLAEPLVLWGTPRGSVLASATPVTTSQPQKGCKI